MKQEEKDLLLKDLCGRLTYGVKVKFGDSKPALLTVIEHDEFGWQIGSEDEFGGMITIIDNVKPYLFPLSSMTDELWDKEFMGYGITEFTRDSFKYGCETLEFNNSNPNLLSMVRFINQLIKNHFDIYGLIPMGLANDATGLNIY